MKILLLISETWNDKKHPNNNMTNWFSDFPDVEIYTVSGGPGLPENKCCKNYFQVSDNMMAKSLLFGKRAGKIIRYDDFPSGGEEQTKAENFVYKNRKKFSFPLMRLIRSVIWRFGRYDKRALREFVEDFNPDIIFTQRMGSVKMCRMEKLVCSFTDAPIIAYTGDNEYSYAQINFFPSHWIHRAWTRAWIRKMAKKYSIYYSMSSSQMQDYAKRFNVETKFLVKCGEFEEENIHNQTNSPIRIVYGGKLYCGRWKTLAIIAEELRQINKNGIRAVLDIYTADKISKKQNKLLNDGVSSTLHKPVSADELKKIYSASDIVLHVESFDLKNRLLTRHSFSTKVMDCLSSGASTLAIAWKKHAALEYLRENDIALTATSQSEIQSILNKVVSNPEILIEYSNKAYEFGRVNHSKAYVQKTLRDDMERVIANNKNKE